MYQLRGEWKRTDCRECSRKFKVTQKMWNEFSVFSHVYQYLVLYFNSGRAASS